MLWNRRSECLNGNSDSVPAPAYVANNCTKIARLYQNRNETGYQLRLNPITTTNFLNRTYQPFRIGNKGSC